MNGGMVWTVSYVAVDLGSRRIGIAVSSSGVLATPHCVLARGADDQETVRQIATLADEVEAKAIILGVPIGGRRSPEEDRRRYDAFAELLRHASGREVILWDEAYSTAEADSKRMQAGKKRKERRSEIDMQAAAVILQSYLDSHQGRQP